MENARLVSREAHSARAGRGKESRAREGAENSRRARRGSTNRPQETESGFVALQFRLRLPPAACLPPPTWSLLAVVGRAVGVVAGAPLLLGSRRGRRAGAVACNRGQAAGAGPGVDNGNAEAGRCRPNPSLVLSRCSLGLTQIPIFPCSVLLISVCQSLKLIC